MSIKSLMGVVESYTPKKPVEEAEVKAPYKAILVADGKKVNLARTATMTLGSVDEEGNVTDMSPKEFLASSLPYKHNSHYAPEFIRALFKTLQLNRQMELNGKMRKMPDDAFEAKLKLLLDLTKRGIKTGG